MRLESTIIERVETFVHHPVFAGSDRTMNLVLDELKSLERNGQIGQATYRRLREIILRSPHIVACR
jgi:small nuclear ribonucleoprotein (snRNP)-like protein